MAEFTSFIEIKASPEAVFDFLITEEGLTSWMGEWASLDPQPHGAFAVDIAGYAIRGEYIVVDRPRRVVVSWGMINNPHLPPGTSRVEFRLTPVDSGTRVDLIHSELPDSEVEGHADGWNHFLPRLGIVAIGEAATPSTWRPLT